MKRAISVLLMVGLLGYFIGNFVVATSQSNAPMGCWEIYKHDVDDYVWNNGEWYWAGVRGYVKVCDGSASIETNTVEHIYAVSWSKGTKIIEGPYKVHTSKIAYTKFEYQRITGETGWAYAVIYANPVPTPTVTMNSGDDS